MNGALRIIAAHVAAFLFTLAVIAFWPLQVKAQEDTCVDVEEDMAIAKAAGFEWVGVIGLPLNIQVLGGAMVFYRKGGIIFASPVFNGCVAKGIMPIGPETGPVLAPSQSTPA